jgi:hypothetical protein
MHNVRKNLTVDSVNDRGIHRPKIRYMGILQVDGGHLASRLVAKNWMQVLMQRVHYFVRFWLKLECVGKILAKLSIVKFNENPFGRYQIFIMITDGQTDIFSKHSSGLESN